MLVHVVPSELRMLGHPPDALEVRCGGGVVVVVVELLDAAIGVVSVVLSVAVTHPLRMIAPVSARVSVPRSPVMGCMACLLR
jgi:hypothetical protein